MKIWMISSSRNQVDQDYLKIAKQIASLLVAEHHDLVCGGLSSGMMKIIYEEFSKKERTVYLYTVSQYREELEVFPEGQLVADTFTRTKELYQRADCVLALPGGSGSICEIMASIEEARTGIKKPIIIYNHRDQYEWLKKLLATLVEERFNDPSIFSYCEFASDPQKVMHLINKVSPNK